MGRSIVGTLAGYVVMIVIVLASIFGTWQALGPAGSFNGEGPYPSTAWVLSNVIFGFLGAYAGGWVARRLGKSDLAIKMLAGLILALGLYQLVTEESAYEKRSADAPDKPVAELTFMEAGMVARSPLWYLWSIPVIGVAGVWLGGRRREAPPEG